jgi:hypothetical protein
MYAYDDPSSCARCLVTDPYHVVNCGNHPVSYDCDKTEENDPCKPRLGTGGTYKTLAECRASCSFSYICQKVPSKGNECHKAPDGTPGSYPGKNKCEAACSPSIPRCNATNYHEFWCTEANVSDTFESLAKKLHVNPNKLAEYNFLYNRVQGVKPGEWAPSAASADSVLDPYLV